MLENDVKNLSIKLGSLKDNNTTNILNNNNADNDNIQNRQANIN